MVYWNLHLQTQHSWNSRYWNIQLGKALAFLSCLQDSCMHLSGFFQKQESGVSRSSVCFSKALLLSLWVTRFTLVCRRSVYFSPSSSPSSSTRSIPLTPWQSCRELPIRKSAFGLAGSTMTWTMLARMSTIILSLRCLDLGRLVTTSRYSWVSGQFSTRIVITSYLILSKWWRLSDRIQRPIKILSQSLNYVLMQTYFWW